MGQLHARHDDRNVRMPGAHLVDDRLEICADLLNRNAAKGIVDPELENEDIDLFVARRSAGSRRKPPVVLSPLDPALTTSNSYPASRIFSSTRAGHACLRERP